MKAVWEEALHWQLKDAAEKLQPTPPEPLPLADGHVFDLGGRKLSVIHTPGHSRGSVCIFDEQTGTLFTGDNVQGMATALTEDCAANVSAYLASMEKLAALPRKIHLHRAHAAVLSPDYIGKKIQCAKRILAGEPGELVRSRAGECCSMTVDGTSIHYTPDRAC